MCLFVDNNNLEGTIAQTNIVCYKIVDVSYPCCVYTPYTKTPIYDGTTTFKAKGNSMTICDNMKDDGVIHVFVNLEDAVEHVKGYDNWRILKCYIPKGTKFYKGVYTVNGFDINKKEYWTMDYDSYGAETIKFLEPINYKDLKKRSKYVNQPLTITSSLFENGSGLVSDITRVAPYSDLGSLYSVGFIYMGISPKGETWSLTKNGKDSRKFLLGERSWYDKLIDWFLKYILKFKVEIH